MTNSVCEVHHQMLADLHNNILALSENGVVCAEKIASTCATVARIEARLEQVLTSNGNQNVNIARLEERVSTIAERAGRNWGFFAGIISAGVIELISLLIQRLVQ